MSAGYIRGGLVGMLLMHTGGAGALAQLPGTPTELPCARSAVLVTVDGGTGSGTMIDTRGYVLTNHHVVAPVLVPGFDGPNLRARAHVRIQIPGVGTLDASEVYDAEIIAADAEIDLALIRITGHAGEAPRDDLRFDAVLLADGDALGTGTSVRVLGYPFGHRTLTILSGTITGRREQTDGTVEWMTTDAPFNPGNSGGTVVDSQCRLVGVPTQVYRGGLNPVNMARPIDARVRAYVDSARHVAERRTPTSTSGAGHTQVAFGSAPSATPDKVQPPHRRRRRR